MKSKVAKDFIPILMITYLCVFLGGLPFSIPILKIQNLITGKDIYSYNINKNIVISKEVLEKKEISNIKSKVDTVERLLEILRQKGIKIVEIPSTENNLERKFRIDGALTIQAYFDTINRLEINFPSMENNFLNGDELLIVIRENS